jgi:hypothetical protein
MAGASRPALPTSVMIRDATREVVRMSPRARKPSDHLDIAPELQGLEITCKLRDAYDQHIRDFQAAHTEIRGRVPVQVLVGLHWMADYPRSSEASALWEKLRTQQPLGYKYAMAIKHAIKIETLVQGKITADLLEDKRRAIDDKLRRLGAPFEFLEDMLKPLQHLPRGRPARKAVLYLRALDFKNANPQTSWGELARKFCGDVEQANSLKAWAMKTKKELAELGVQISLTNPDYEKRKNPRRVKR